MGVLGQYKMVRCFSQQRQVFAGSFQPLPLTFLAMLIECRTLKQGSPGDHTWDRRYISIFWGQAFCVEIVGLWFMCYRSARGYERQQDREREDRASGRQQGGYGARLYSPWSDYLPFLLCLLSISIKQSSVDNDVHADHNHMSHCEMWSNWEGTLQFCAIVTILAA